MINPSVCLSVCLSASISLEPLDRCSRNFVCRSPVAVARSSSGGVALCHVLPVLWMTLRLAVIGARPARVGNPQRRGSITCATGAESDVSECLLLLLLSETVKLEANDSCRQTVRSRTAEGRCTASS